MQHQHCTYTLIMVSPFTLAIQWHIFTRYIFYLVKKHDTEQTLQLVVDFLIIHYKNTHNINIFTISLPEKFLRPLNLEPR